MSLFFSPAELQRVTGHKLSMTQADALQNLRFSYAPRVLWQTLRSLDRLGLAVYGYGALTPAGVEAAEAISNAYEYGSTAAEYARVSGLDIMDAFEAIRNISDDEARALIEEAREASFKAEAAKIEADRAAALDEEALTEQAEALAEIAEIEPSECPGCGGTELTLLGFLGRREHRRCRSCGLDSSVSA